MATSWNQNSQAKAYNEGKYDIYLAPPMDGPILVLLNID